MSVETIFKADAVFPNSRTGRFARLWGQLMDVHVSIGLPLQEIAAPAAEDAMEYQGKLSPEDFREAAVLLVENWEHGPELMTWWNNENGVSARPGPIIER